VGSYDEAQIVCGGADVYRLSTGTSLALVGAMVP